MPLTIIPKRFRPSSAGVALTLIIATTTWFALESSTRPARESVGLWGRVTASDTQVLGDVEVVCYRISRIGAKFELHEEQRTRTKDDGTYRMQLPHPGHYMVLARLEGFVTTQIWNVYLSEASDLLLDFSLAIGSLHLATFEQISGHVLAPSGKPADNATVTIQHIGTTRRHQLRTDQEGSYSIPTFNNEDYVIWATKPGFGAAAGVVQLRGGPATLDLRLSEAK